MHCAIPENIHTPPTEGIGISWGVVRSLRPKNLKKCIKFNWNFQRGGGSCKKSLPCGRYEYFLELHIEKFYQHLAELLSKLQCAKFSPILIGSTVQLLTYDQMEDRHIDDLKMIPLKFLLFLYNKTNRFYVALRLFGN